MNQLIVYLTDDKNGHHMLTSSHWLLFLSKTKTLGLCGPFLLLIECAVFLIYIISEIVVGVELEDFDCNFFCLLLIN